MRYSRVISSGLRQRRKSASMASRRGWEQMVQRRPWWERSMASDEWRVKEQKDVRLWVPAQC